MREHELKFEVDESFRPEILEELHDYEVDELVAQVLAATYYDTADLKLARWGASLRYRKGDDGGDGWTLKLPVDGSREELGFEAPPTSIPTEAKNLATALTRGAELKPVATIRTKRRRWAIREAAGEPQLAELAFDEVSVLRSRRIVDRFREIEVEAVGTDGIGVAKIGNALRKSGARETDQAPKVVRALGEAAMAPPDIGAVDEVGPSDPAKDAIRAALVANVGRLITNDPLTRAGNPEGLHQMRVACRRTRSDLKTFEPLVDEEWAAEITRELRWIANVLGKVRDLDVMIERLQQSSKDLDSALNPLFEALQEKVGATRQAAAAALGSKRYVELLDRLVAAAIAPPTTQEAERPCAEVLVPLVASRWRKLAGAAQSTGQEAPDEVLHDIRIKAKKVRYAAEAVAPSMGKKIRKELLSFAEKVAVLQDVLGAHQDATVAMATIGDAAKDRADDPDFVFAAGRLYERESLAAKTSRKESKTTWGKIDRKKNLGWLTT